MTEIGSSAIRAEILKKAKGGAMDAWKQSKVYSPAQKSTQTKDVVDTRRVLERCGREGGVKKRAWLLKGIRIHTPEMAMRKLRDA